MPIPLAERTRIISFIIKATLDTLSREELTALARATLADRYLWMADEDLAIEYKRRGGR